MTKSLNELVVIDADKTLGALVFKKFERATMNYVDGKNTGEIKGYRFKVESQNLMDVIEVMVEDTTMDVAAFEETPEVFYNQRVKFRNLRLIPYADTNGSFAKLAWSIKADAILVDVPKQQPQQ